LYEKLLDDLAPSLPTLQRLAAALAELDALATLAERAVALDYRYPDSPVKRKSKSSRTASCGGGADRRIHRQYTRLDNGRRLLLITGPNMGGKSTYMRQTALIVLLAHVGSFVPAKRAVIGPVDQIFTRIGASDDLAGGRSTFMVEMTEAANILPQRHKHIIGADGRSGPRHIDLRRHGARDRHRPPSCGNQPELHAVSPRTTSN